MAPLDNTKPPVTGKPLPPPPSLPSRGTNSKQTLYRQPYPHNRSQRPTTRRICCCCCFWSLLLLLITLLLASLLAIAIYLLYHPRPPSFTIPSLRVHRFNLTTTNDETSSARLSSLFNLTLITKNPNSHFTYNYQPFSVVIMTEPDEIFLGNGTVPAFLSGEKNTTSFRGVVVEAREVVDEETSALRKKMKSKRLVLKVVMETKVEIRIGKLKSKRVGIRVTCGEIKGNLVPKGKGIAMANVDKSKCKVDLRIKIWNWTF